MKLSKTISAILAMCMVFLLIPAFAVADEKGQPLGDINLDGVLNTADAALILKYSASIFFPTEEQLKYADANLDTLVNTADASFILQVAAGMREPNYANDSYSISFSSGSLSESVAVVPAPMDAKPGSTVTITFIAAAQGHEFRGWLADFDSCLYKIGESFVMPERNITLTALWDNEQAPSASAQPTAAPTQAPTNSYVTFSFYDYFNEMSVVAMTKELTDGTYTFDINNVELPEGYKLKNNNFSATVIMQNGVATPAVVNVEVYHYAVSDGNREFYVIDSEAGFAKVRQKLNGNYMLNTDIDLHGEMFVPIGWNDTSIDCVISDFTGIFDGNNHLIDNLYMDYNTMPTDGESSTRDGYGFYRDVALFACNEGTIRNLNVQITYPNDEGIFGVFGDCNVGTFAGWNGGKLINCHAIGNVGSLYCGDNLQYGTGGGVCGNNNGLVQYCSFEGGVEGFSYIGGICGKNFGTVEECFFAGGINGALDAEYVWQYSIFGIGGICGASSINGASGGITRNCYAYLTYYVNGDSFVGGIVGWAKGGSVSSCYCVNANLLQWTSSNGGAIVGGFATSGGPTISNCYELSTNTANDELPYGFSTSVWDMNANLYSMLPDLINNRRPDRWADED